MQPLARGSRLGPYEILEPIGAGGMGEVYRARDSRLDRDVAIKILSSALDGDAAALVRFEREAVSVAKLSHPNIVSIYEFARDGAGAFVVSELVDGETLRARLDAAPIAPRRAIGYALQLARGMAAAHGRGIVHRDLKPENVMITRDDQIKILDFGLAKPVPLDAGDLTRGAASLTNAGLVLGTIGYMAPEQLRGLAVDHRADMFSFGAVVYEMLAGERAFRGETAADTMTAILAKEPPDLDLGKLAIPPSLDRIVRRCLEKSPDLRFQSANDLAFALETLSTGSTSSGAVPAAVLPSVGVAQRWLPWALAGLAAAAALTTWVVTRRQPLEPRWSSFTRISESAGDETSPTISPDGRTVAYVIRVNGSLDIYAQRVGGRNATPLVNDPQRDEAAPKFSPDGSLLAFHESDDVGGIFVAGATGESVRRITEVGFDPAWSPDAARIAYGTEEIVDPASRIGVSSIFVVDAAGGTPQRIVAADGVQPAWSPSGRRIVYWSNTGGQRDIYTIPSGGGERIAITNDAFIDWSPIWSPDGRFIYFASDRGGAMNLWRIAVDEASGRPLSAPEPVTAGAQASAALPVLSGDGSRLAFRSRVASVNPIAIPFDPATMRAGTPILLDTQNNARIPSAVSPDGKLIAYYSLGDQQEDLFIGTADGPMRRVTDDAPRDRAPIFTPDGRSLVFYSNRDGKWAVWAIGIDGGGLRRVAGEAAGAVYVQISPAGDRVAFVDESGHVVHTAPFPAKPGVAATVLRGTVVNGKYFSSTHWSPDGRQLAGTLVSASGRNSGVGIYEFATERAIELSGDEAYAAKWLSDSRRVVYFGDAGRELVVFDTASRRRTVVDLRLPARAAINEMFAISPDDRTIYYGGARAEADIWIIERK
jgi:Tol biopolymer transport system component/serine/threonine protein kinase